MSTTIGPVLFTLFVWWFSTGLILWLDRLPPRTFPRTMAGASLVAIAGLVALYRTRDMTSVEGAYIAFTAAIAVWAWHECSFLLGYVAGPERCACPRDCRGWARFVRALRSILHHELALAASAALVAALTADGANKVGLWTFLVLWVMRISTKINLFLGVRNVGAEFLPQDLRYIATYFGRRPMNLFFPLPVTLGAAGLACALRDLADPALSAFDTAALAFFVTLLALGVIEHWFLVAPLSIAALWGWSLRSRGAASVQKSETPAQVVRLVAPSRSAGRRA